jgi:hypothetical protein
LAIFKLITSSYLVCTGSSAGFSPYNRDS